MEVIKIPKVEGIIDRRTGRVLNRKLRVAAYARVSTTGAEQLNSYESQKKYYYEKINDNPKWEFVNIYADEGISGTTDYKRAGFMKMIQESKNISEHVKLGLRMKMNRGELIGFTKCYGYEYDSASENFKIIEEEAEVVKYIFDQYCAGHGANGIAKMLTQQGIKTPKGRKTWCDSTIRGILRNEKYKGDVLQGKTYTSDPISHKRYRNMGEADKYYIANHHEPIIDEKQFEFVQEILKENCGARVNGRRSGNVGRKFAFSSRIRCGFCGNSYVRRTVAGKDRGKIPSWSCMSFARKGKTACTESKTIREEMIKEAFVDSYKLLCANKA